MLIQPLWQHLSKYLPAVSSSRPTSPSRRFIPRCECLEERLPLTVFGNDDRYRINSLRSFPYRAMGWVAVTYQDGTGGSGSGVMIDPFHFLTAGHVLYDHDHGWATAADVYLAAGGSLRAYHAEAVQVAIQQGWYDQTTLRDPTTGITYTPPDFDLGLVTLDRPLGDRTGWLGYQALPNSFYNQGGRLYTAGYPGDLPTRIDCDLLDDPSYEPPVGNGTVLYGASGTASGTTAMSIYFSGTLDVCHGQSGSPIWSDDGESHFYVNAVVNAGNDQSNRAVRLTNAFPYDNIGLFINDVLQKDRQAGLSTGDPTRRAVGGSGYNGGLPPDKSDLRDGDRYNGTYSARFNRFTLQPGDLFDVSATVLNLGTAAAGSFTVSFYASADSTITSGDYLLGTSTVSSLPALGSGGINWNGPLPNLPPGRYYVGWIIDSGNTQAEYDETDNTGVIDWWTINVNAPFLGPGTLTQFAGTGGIGGSSAHNFSVVDSAGNFWYSKFGNDTIGRITPGGSIREFPLPPNSNPSGITVGPDGHIWFTQFMAGKISRITPDGTITDFPLPLEEGYPDALTTGADGNLWFTLLGRNGYRTGKIGRMTPTGAWATFPVPGDYPALTSITGGLDGNVWFTTRDTVGQITPAGIITVSDLGGGGSNATSIVAGPDGNLWFVQGSGIRRMTPGGYVTGFSGPTPGTLAFGPDGYLWFAGSETNSQGRIFSYLCRLNPYSGEIDSLPVDFYAGDVAAGPQGTVWVADGNGPTIARVVNPQPAAPVEQHAFDLVVPFVVSPLGSASDYAATIDWGDGFTSPGNLTANSTGGYDVRGSHTYSAARPRTIQVTFRHRSTGVSTTATISAAVQNIPPTANNDVRLDADAIVEGQSVTVSGSFADPSQGDAHTVRISWGDGSADTVLDLPAGVFSFGGITHRYPNNPAGQPSGRFPIRITVSDSGGGTATVVASVQVANLSPQVASVQPAAALVQGKAAVLRAAVSDPGAADALSYAWRVTRRGKRYAQGSSPTLRFRPLEAGAYLVTLTVTDADGVSSVFTTTIRVRRRGR